MVGSSLARRIARENESNDYGQQVAEIAAEIEGDKAKLGELMKRLGIRKKQLRLGMAWAAEKGMRLKPNGRPRRLFAAQPRLELEGLTMGITGKLELWRSLQAIADGDGRLPEAEIDALIHRAESQRDRVEDLRIKAAREALSGVD